MRSWPWFTPPFSPSNAPAGSCTVQVVLDDPLRRPGRPVDDWFAARTSAIDDWSVESLRGLKAGRRISVVLPALDEEATVGDIVATIRADLAPGAMTWSTTSSWSTAAHATRPPPSRQPAAPGWSRCPTSCRTSRRGRGKGEAMWRGVAATDADLVVFVDADLKSFDSRFVVALLGPLLSDPSIQFVKAAYDRPPTDPAVPSNGGGRVTELMARPLISAFWPDLSGVLQPLAGEYAAQARPAAHAAVPVRLRRRPRPAARRLPHDRARRHRPGRPAPALASPLRPARRSAGWPPRSCTPRSTAWSTTAGCPADLDVATLLWQPDRVEGGVRTARHVSRHRRAAAAARGIET